MQHLLESLLRVYQRVEVLNRAKSLFHGDADACNLASAYLSFMALLKCFERIIEFSERLSTAQTLALDDLLSDTQLYRSLNHLYATASSMREPEAVLDCLMQYASALDLLREKFEAIQTS